MHSFSIVLFLLSLFTIISASPTKRQQLTEACGFNCFAPGSILSTDDFAGCPGQTPEFSCTCSHPNILQKMINCVSQQCNDGSQETLFTELDLRCLQAGVATLTGVTTPGVSVTPTFTIIDVATSSSASSNTSTPTTTRSSGAISLTYSSHAFLVVCLGALTASMLL